MQALFLRCSLRFSLVLGMLHPEDLSFSVTPVKCLRTDVSVAGRLCRSLSSAGYLMTFQLPALTSLRITWSESSWHAM